MIGKTIGEYRIIMQRIRKAWKSRWKV